MLCRSVVFVAGFALAAALTNPASARTVYDGNWSVLIVTKSGPCDAAYRYGLSIRDGQVFYEGSASVNVRGRVNRTGNVDVMVSAGQQGASGSGRALASLWGGRVARHRLDGRVRRHVVGRAAAVERFPAKACPDLIGVDVGSPPKMRPIKNQ